MKFCRVTPMSYLLTTHPVHRFSGPLNVKFHLLLCLFSFSVFNLFVILLAIVAGTKSSILVDVLMQIHGYFKGCSSIVFALISSCNLPIMNLVARTLEHRLAKFRKGLELLAHIFVPFSFFFLVNNVLKGFSSELPFYM
jgi:hypothetical protein